MANKRIGAQTVVFERRPYIIGRGNIGGKKEGEGPLAACFDQILEDDMFGEKTWEKAECRMLMTAMEKAMKRARLKKENIDIMLSGDLINQLMTSSFAARDLHIPFLGLYGACSTMAEGLLMSAIYTDSGTAERAVAVTSSHFSTAERQFRYPLSYGGQRTPTSQWTCTGSGAAVIDRNGKGPVIIGGCIGKITDMGINDINNMGAAMAPAAAETIRRYLSASGNKPSDYDYIITGDLGITGSKLLIELLNNEGIDINTQHRDCGAMIFDPKTQDTHCGGSGCGCSASVLCGYFLPMLKKGDIKRILFAATGALMSPMACQQGETIPSISHLVDIKGGI